MCDQFQVVEHDATSACPSPPVTVFQGTAEQVSAKYGADWNNIPTKDGTRYTVHAIGPEREEKEPIPC